MGWYRDRAETDEHTGELVAMRKRFASDMLQRDYNQIVKQLCCKKNTARLAVKKLAGLGLVRMEFRTVRQKNGSVANNVLFWSRYRRL